MKNLKPFSLYEVRNPWDEDYREQDHKDPEVDYQESLRKFDTLSYVHDVALLHKKGGDKYDLWLLELDGAEDSDKIDYFGGDLDYDGRFVPDDPNGEQLANWATDEYDANRWTESDRFDVNPEGYFLWKITADNVGEIIDYINKWYKVGSQWHQPSSIQIKGANEIIGHLSRLYPET
jgi:hypothetical protein